MEPRPDRLDVYYGGDLVGAVHDSAPLAFDYAPDWLGGGQCMSLAAIKLQPGRQATPAARALRVVDHQEAGSALDRLKAAAGKTHPWENCPS